MWRLQLCIYPVARREHKGSNPRCPITGNTPRTIHLYTAHSNHHRTKQREQHFTGAIYNIGRSHASRGHTITFPQDISDFTHALPSIPQELPVIVLKILNATITDKSFLVRRDKLIPSLQFCKEINEDYQHIVQSVIVFCNNYLN